MADIVKTASDIITLTTSSTGNDIPWTEPATADVVYIPNPTKSFYLLVNNTDAADTPVLTIAGTPAMDNADALGAGVDDVVYTCGTEEMVQLGPFKTSLFNTADDDSVSANSVKITLSGTFTTGDLQLAFIAVP